jgi:hypothetical protein
VGVPSNYFDEDLMYNLQVDVGPSSELGVYSVVDDKRLYSRFNRIA